MMTDRTPKKPVVGSRAPSGAPRRVAGRGSPRQQPPVGESAEPTPAERLDSAVAPPSSKTPKPPRERTPGPLHSSRTTRVLAVVLGVLVLVAVVLGGLLAWDAVDDPGDATGSSYQFDPKEEFTVPDEPITIPLVEWRSANKAASDSVKDILTVSWKTYDDHLADVEELMTGGFAEEYAATHAGSRDKFLESRAEYEFAVVGSSVVHARPDKVTSLLFLNQFVYKGEGKDRVGPEVYQVRVVVTTERSGGKWLVSSLDAQ